MTGTTRKFLIVPHGICDFCGNCSGPKVGFDDLRGPSLYHRRNIMPHGAQCDAVMADITDTTAQICLLDSEIDRLEKALLLLKDRRESLKRYKAQELSLFAPIRLFPDEVLQYVFLMVRDGCEDEKGFVSVTNARGCVQMITKVCAHWRSVAYSFPRLWSRLTVHFCSSTKNLYAAGNQPHLEKFITLSADVPLELKLNSTPELLGDRVIRTIAKSAKRWKDVTIDNYGGLLQAISAHIPPTDVYSNLESLKIMFKAGDFALKDTPLLTHLTVDNVYRQSVSRITLASAPSLSSFSVTGLRNLQRILVNFPWDQITTFKSINCIFAKDELAAILSSMPNLTSLTFHGEPNTSRQIFLSQLQTLTLDAASDLQDVDITRGDAIELLVAPKLKALHCIEFEISKPAIHQLLRRSSCYLEELTVFRTKVEDGWRAKWLVNLKKLCLKRPRNIIQELHWLRRGRRDGPDVLPHLETLDLQDIPFGAKNVVQSILPMIKSRLAPIYPGATGSGLQGSTNISYLKTVTMNFERDLNKREKRQLGIFMSSKHVRQSGVVINVKYGEYPSESDSEPAVDEIDEVQEMRLLESYIDARMRGLYGMYGGWDWDSD